MSPTVTVQYSPFDSLMLFATRTTGFKSGGFNNLGFTPEGAEVGPEDAVSWEAGAKGTLFDDTLSYAGTFFNTQVENLKLQTNIGGAIIITKNVASARSRGVELDFEWLAPWQPLTVRGSGSLTYGKFLRFPDAPAPQSADSTAQDLSGRRLPWVPERQLDGTPELRFPFDATALPGVGRLLPRVLVVKTALDLLYRSNIYLTVDLDRFTLQDQYAKLNGRLSLATEDDAFSLTATVRNITDAEVLDFAEDALFFPGGFIEIQEVQRYFTFDADYHW